LKQKIKHAKAELQGETNKNYKTVAEDWTNWIEETQEGIRQAQAEWTSSDNPMVTVKPRIKKNKKCTGTHEKRPGYNLETEDGLHPTPP
jgi:hypothetical protein